MAYSRVEEQWYQEHTDTVFGRPVDDCHRWHEARSADGLKIIAPRPYEFNAPVRYTETGFVKVRTDEFPLINQKAVFLWIEAEMEHVAGQVPELLLRSKLEDLEDESWFEPVVQPAKAAEAFKPKHIYHISFKGISPVVWRIRFYSLVEQNCRGTIRGEDMNIKSAMLWLD